MNNYVSTGNKTMRHLNVLKRFQDERKLTPISIQIAPTSRCNLRCSFCSNINRKQHESLPLEDIMVFINQMKRLGARTIEWTGGGDPTQYQFINSCIYYASKMGYKQGLITNGVELIDKVGETIACLDWIRISLNALEYVDEIQIPKDYKGTLGFSYVINKKTNDESIKKIKECAIEYNPKYVRIVPDCQISAKELNEKNHFFSEWIAEWGAPFFYQAKSFSQPKRCWWGHIKPFLLHDGYVYPCSSVVLNDTAERSFHEKFRWHRMNQFASIFGEQAIPFDCKDCTNCVFGAQNSLIESLIDEEMEDFV